MKFKVDDDYEIKARGRRFRYRRKHRKPLKCVRKNISWITSRSFYERNIHFIFQLAMRRSDSILQNRT